MELELSRALDPICNELRMKCSWPFHSLSLSLVVVKILALS